MDDRQLLRYSRHILLPEIGVEGQQKLLAARALVIGAGGLGSPVALYLASAGVGHIVLCDNEEVDLTNLQRQIVHRTTSIGMKKVDSARATLSAINPEIDVVGLAERVDRYLHRPATELYDLEADPLERKNLVGSGDHADVEHELRARLRAAAAAIGDPLAGRI